jgi:hypothetical protein
MVAEGNGFTIEESFAALRAHARRTMSRLVDVAQDVVDGVLPASLIARPGGPA